MDLVRLDKFLLKFSVPNLMFEVDEDDDFECAGVLTNHSQDVKDVSWHPTDEVSLKINF